MSFHFKQILVLSDNSYLCNQFIEVCNEKNISLNHFDFAHSPATTTFEVELLPPEKNVCAIDIKAESEKVAMNYDLVFSIHCKQLFPDNLIQKVKCINLHPGLNPHNRGWYPQVFSILNKLPLGATLHEIDEHLDHGAIIAQKEVEVFAHDTSITAYSRVLEAERELLEKHLVSILENSYRAVEAKEEGNVNLKKDFNALCELELDKIQTIGDTIDLLRALTHGDYRNAFFRNKEGKKVMVSIKLELNDE